METDNEKTEKDGGVGIFPSIGSLTISLFVLFIIYFFFHLTGQTENVTYAIAGVIVVTLSVIVYISISSSLLPTDERIIEALENAGYESDMEEGFVYFKKDGCKWWIYPVDVSKRYRRVYFILSFFADYLDENHTLANKIICVVGRRNQAVLTTWNGKDSVEFRCCTVLTSTKDIMREFTTATNAINTAASEYFALKEQFFDSNISKEEHKIGFQAQGKKEVEKRV